MEDKNLFGLPIRVIHRICAIFKKHSSIKKVILYGSRAMGREKTGSDIDLCIDSDDLTLTELLAIENEIDELFLPWKIDLSLKQQIDNLDLLQHIQSVGILFCQPHQTD